MARRRYTPELARRSLPLVSAIAGDIRDTAQKIRQIWLEPRDGSRAGAVEERLAELRRRFSELVSELDTLGVELKDPVSGLLDFRAQHYRWLLWPGYWTERNLWLSPSCFPKPPRTSRLRAPPGS